MNKSITYIAPLWPPIFLLSLTNILNLIYPLPVMIQLFLNACVSIHLGCLISASLTKVSYQQVLQCEQEMRSRNDLYTQRNLWQILQVPLLGCIILFGLYIIVKNSQKEIVDTMLDIIFVILVVVYGSNKVHHTLLWFLDLFNIQDKMNENIWNIFLKVSKYIFCPLLSLLMALIYIDTKHWLINNLFGLILSISSIKYGNFRSFKIALPILWCLFFYDMFWVYSTQVMVTVAKGVNLPLKLLFPYLNMVGQVQFSMLGCGDIIIPGFFLSLCFKYDIDNLIVKKQGSKLKQFGMKLYNIALLSYILALLLTFLALYVFNHPQPALVFIVPCLSLSLLFNKCLGNKLSLFQYDSSTMSKSEESLERV